MDLRVRPELARTSIQPLLKSFAKEHGIPAIYYTDNISARPIIFASGAASVLGMIAGLIEKREIYGRMKEYFMPSA